MSRTMLNEQSLPQKFWCNAVDTSTYILNRILIRAILGKTPYELFRDRKPTLDYFRVFGSKCFILNTKDYITKFDPKSYEGVFLCYSQNSKAYIIINKHTRKIKESLNVTFDETPPPFKTSPLVDDDLDEEEAIKGADKKILENDIEDETLEIDEVVNIKESRNHPLFTTDEYTCSYVSPRSPGNSISCASWARYMIIGAFLGHPKLDNDAPCEHPIHDNDAPCEHPKRDTMLLLSTQNSCSEDKETVIRGLASSKSAKECSLNSETQDVHAIKYKMSKAKERCMTYF
ncbi:retrovirus-related pol polyprotein from transposon TNT 1-94 [Tanacetum coccineum]